MKEKADLLVVNIGELVTFRNTVPGEISVETVDILHDSGIAIRHGRIFEINDTEKIEGKYDGDQIDAEGKLVTPGLIDTHTHMIFAGTREDELEKKLLGYTYKEILEAGGGIHRTVRLTRKADIRELVDASKKTIWTMIKHGTTVIEAKGGYGLDLENEIKILETIKILSAETPVRMIPTTIAHVVPPEYKDNRRAYLDYYLNTILPEVKRRNLAIFSDVFCDVGAFTVEETRVILEKSLELGYKLRIHADQLGYIGCSKLAAEFPLIALEHLDYMPEENAFILSERRSVAGLTPTSALAMFAEKKPPIHVFRKHGIPMAVSTDFNPNNMTPSMQLAMDLSVYLYRLTPIEALAGATINAAASLDLLDTYGRIRPGYVADLVVWNIPNYRWIGYLWGINKVKATIIGGRKIFVD